VVWLIADLVWLPEVIAVAEMWQLCFFIIDKPQKWEMPAFLTQSFTPDVTQLN